MPKSTPRARVGIGLGIGVWCSLVLSGFLALIAYADRPGEVGTPPETWPAEVSIAPDPTAPTLLVFLHPHCPCSTATMDELERLLGEARGDVRTILVYGRPSGEGDAWASGGLWERGVRIPGATRVIDAGGRLASSFGATTSGHTILYDAEGRLVFHGGITDSRGHEGASYGRAALRDAIDGLPISTPTLPVFGCPLVRDGTSAEACELCGEGAP
ncbi:MAG: hypothetical protein R3B57_13340 [Phycisphaerales bacterium]